MADHDCTCNFPGFAAGTAPCLVHGLHKVGTTPIVVFDDVPPRPCPLCGAVAVLPLPAALLAVQPDDTTHVCHPVYGGCNHGFAVECDGHPAGPGDHMGQTVYCDGTCRALTVREDDER